MTPQAAISIDVPQLFLICKVLRWLVLCVMCVAIGTTLPDGG